MCMFLRDDLVHLLITLRRIITSWTCDLDLEPCETNVAVHHPSLGSEGFCGDILWTRALVRNAGERPFDISAGESQEWDRSGRSRIGGRHPLPMPNLSPYMSLGNSYGILDIPSASRSRTETATWIGLRSNLIRESHQIRCDSSTLHQRVITDGG